MSLSKLTMRRMTMALAAASAVAITGAAAAQSMVVRSTGPSASKYPTGTRLKDSDKITLIAGDRVVVMQSGKTRTISGPGSFNASGPVSASQNTSTAVTRMLAKGPTMRSRGGFSRGTDSSAVLEARAPNLWLLDYREGGNFCVADAAGLLLWRPDMDSDELLRIEQGGRADTIAFVSGANYRKWPSETLPLQFDVDYKLSGGGLPAPVTVRFAALPAMPEGPEASMEALISKNCAPQVDRLVAALGD